MGPYFSPQSSKSESGFEYPDPESTFDVHSEHQTQIPQYPVSSGQNCYLSPSPQTMYQAESSIAEHPRQSSCSILWREEPSFGQVTPVLPSTTTVPHPLDSASQDTKKVNREFVPYPAGRQQAPRGTTGTIVCADCGGRFTVRSSLNRHSKICRGRKKARRSASTQHDKVKVPDADSMSHLSVHPSAADERDSFSSERGGSVTGFNSNIYHTPTKRTRSASHDTEDSILANKLSDYNSLTAESNWSPLAQHDQSEGLDSHSHILSATNPFFNSSNAQYSSLTSGLHAPSPYSQKAIGIQSYVPQSRDTSAAHNPFCCDVCYTIFPRPDLLQIHRASAHGSTEKPWLPE